MSTKTAIVVGGGQSLGEALCHRLAEDYYNIVVVDIDKAKADQVAAEVADNYEIKTTAFKCDATKEDEVEDLITHTKENFASIDLLVYNAGIAVSQKITNFELPDWDKTVGVNLKGYFLCAREVSKVMIEQGYGNIIQINSKSGKVGSKHNSAYSASKFGGVGLTQSLALDLAEHNIRVNSIMPGNLLDSPMFQSLIPQYAKKLNINEDEVIDVYKEKVPLKRGCTYDDIANAVIFYASDKASYMTGQSINVTGGQVMH
ncbi:sorbitol-6-phosphate dehydrogenase [Salipaludibacillus sp. CUR1]|uniref:sorbitol-6-phosphate dehydrogenase n=1 Tax=Salipaludibacillus sp. CUR1 TaxID=2820003 RepID=UPI001E3AAA75|nr:sorbitol-6-phosphate dehydrogenase [Salipaludibacillus sp. CUR1]MCE7792919.1 sorbitol-6-phosphate dehydrogenase [Salipaludibacillus sp. CUR1]